MQERPVIGEIIPDEPDISKILKREIDGLPDPYMLLLLTQPQTHFTTFLRLLDYAVNKEKMTGTCVSITRTVSTLKKIMIAKGINPENMTFVDCISKLSGSPKDSPDCFYVSHPSNLTDLSIAITNAINRMEPGKRFFIVDSWSSLLIYNDQKKVLGFSNFIINKLRANNINGLIVTMRVKTDEEFENSLSVFCEKVVNL